MSKNINVLAYRNRIEMKILSIVYLVVGIPTLILLIYSSLSEPSNLIALIVFPILVLPLFVINRFKIVIDMTNGLIIYTGYFKSTKTYKLSSVVVRISKGKTTLSNDIVFGFFFYDKIIFKISSIDFEGQTGKNIDQLRVLLVNDCRILLELEKGIVINNGYIVMNSYEIDEDIAVVYLSNGVSIDLGYIELEDKFFLTVYKENNWNNQLEVIEVADDKLILENLQQLINKYEL
jgi:hypothetical protein